MTTELEEQFFKTFEIEPKVKCDIIKTTNMCICFACPHYKNIDGETGEFQNLKYPEISDRKLLEMICIYNSTYTNGYTNYSLLNERNVEKLKEQILKNCLIVRDDIKHQIQQLFKEEE